MSNEERPWDDAKYQRFAAASGDGHELRVRFENGDEVALDLRRLADLGEATPRWDDLRTTPYELVVSVNGNDVELSWLEVRQSSDDQLALFLAETAEEEAKQVGRHLRLLREERGMSAKELADRAGLAPQSLSRIERGRHDVVFSTLSRLLAAMNFDLADLGRVAEVQVSVDQVERALITSGLSRATVRRVLHGANSAGAALGRVNKIFGWSPTDVAGPGSPPMLAGAAVAGRLKEQARSKPAAWSYILYAHRLAADVHRSAKRPAYESPTDDPAALAQEIRARYGDLRFESLARFAWDCGIPIVPLPDRGQFHGACWMFDGRPVIVLKQRLSFNARWAFDLAHELCHVLRHLEDEVGIVEFEEIAFSSDDGEEAEASEFAGQLLLGDPEALTQEAVQAAGGRVERLKGIAGQVAERHHVDQGALANYLAYRLSLQERLGAEPVDWWGTAANLQESDTGADQVAHKLLEEHLDWGRLEDDDQLLLRGGLESEEAI